jgi:hypothetical protein
MDWSNTTPLNPINGADCGAIFISRERHVFKDTLTSDFENALYQWLLPLASVTQDLVWADREAAPRRRRGSRAAGVSGETY